MVELFGTEKVAPDKITKAVDEVFDLRPAAIIRDLDLRRPIYRRTATYGHFGRSDKDAHLGGDQPAGRVQTGSWPLVVVSSALVRRWSLAN